MKDKYSKKEMKNIIEHANKLKKEEEESYTIEQIEQIAKNMNIPKRTVKEALKIYDKNTTSMKKSGGNPTKRRIKRILFYLFYLFFWAALITVLLIVPDTYENRWASWVWVIPSMGFIGLIIGAFIEELEGAIIGTVSGGLSGLFIVYLGGIFWGKISIGLVLAFLAFLVFVFRFKEKIDAVIK